MKKPIRNILIALAVIFTIFFAVAGYGIYSFYSFFSKSGQVAETEIPLELKEARILTGSDFIKKTEFFKLDNEELLQTIGKSSTISDEKKRKQYIDAQLSRKHFGFDDLKVCGDEVIAVGKFGGFALTGDGKLLREIMFEPKTDKISVFGFEQEHYRSTLDNLRIHDFENDGKCEFFSNSSIDGVVVFDGDGNAIWRHGEREINLNDAFKQKSPEQTENESWITGAFAGDLNNDGISELIVTKKNDGIRAFDVNRNEIWFQPNEYPTAKYKIFDSDGDGKNDLLEFQGASSALRNAQTGEMLKKLPLDYGLDDVVVSKDKNGKTNFLLFKINENKLKVYDLSDKVQRESDAPLSDVKKAVSEKPKTEETPFTIGNVKIAPSEYGGDDTESVYQPKAIFVKLKADAPEFLAVVGSFIGIPRSNFYIYDNAGKLVYHELLPENAETIEILPTSDGRQEILIGGKSSIWKYAVK